MHWSRRFRYIHMDWGVLGCDVLWLCVLLSRLLGSMLWLLLQIRSVMSWRLTIGVIVTFFRLLLQGNELQKLLLLFQQFLLLFIPILVRVRVGVGRCFSNRWLLYLFWALSFLLVLFFHLAPG